jgi:hypothetical protein
MRHAKRPVRLWLNQWFSTAYHIVNLIRKDENFNFFIIGSNKNQYSPVSCVCDEWYVEPEDIDDESYFYYCLDFCKKHEIEVFIPHRAINLCVHRLMEFEKAGVKVLAEKISEFFDLCYDKISAYKFRINYIPQCIPEYTEVRSAEEFIKAYLDYSENYEKVCYKISSDEGALSFRVFDVNVKKILSSQPESFTAWLNSLYERASLGTQKRGKKCAVMVMPYLQSPEISVDMLKTSVGFIVIPRYKINGRFEKIKYDDVVVQLCETLLGHIPLCRPCNLQFRHCNGVPYLLEINTRMSGGIQLSYIGTGVNIPNIAINQLFGIEKTWRIKREEVNLSYIETPLRLEHRNEI